MRLAGQMHEAAFHGAGLGIEAHDLVAFGLVAGDRADAGLTQLLNKLRARGLVLNQDHARPEEPELLDDGTLEIWIAEFLRRTFKR